MSSIDYATDMANSNLPHHIFHEEVVDPGDYGVDYDVWDGTVAHEVTVDEGDEYIQVDELDGVPAQYMDHHHVVDDQVYDHHGGYHPHHLQLQPQSDLLHYRADGSPLFTIHIAELVSKEIEIPGQSIRSKSIRCFNKKCQPQFAFEGFLYTLTGHSSLNEMAYNIWRCADENCSGALRTSPNFATAKLRCDHSDECVNDQNQIRIRVATYDLMLMAEFIHDCDMYALYNDYTNKLKMTQPDLGHAFPDYGVVREMMEHHSVEMPFRKRFEARKTLYQRRREGLVIERSKFRRTKPFPPSICVDCNAEFPSGDLAPSQDLLIQHLTYIHEKPLVIERFTFPEPQLFESWIRELTQHSRYRLRRVGLFDEHMYYLCTSDDRVQRCNHGRGSIINTQCSAFIRVHDFRYVLRREMKQVIVDYCLDHCFHSGESPLPDTYRAPMYDYYSPEVFMKEMEAKKTRTQKMLMNVPASVKSMRRLITDPNPIYQQGAEEVYLMDQYNQMDMQGQEWVPEEQYEQHQEMQEAPQPARPTESSGRVTFNLTNKKEIPFLREDQRTGTNHLTMRHNFDDRSTFETVMNLELQCDTIKQRMQQCRRPDVAKRYLQKITGILEDVMADPHCSPKYGAVPIEHDLEEAPGPSAPRARKVTLQIPAGPKGVVKTGQVQDGAPVRQAMFLKKGENGEMIVVKRVIKRVRKAVEVVPGQEAIVTPTQPHADVIPMDQDILVEAEDVSPHENHQEMPTNFLEEPVQPRRGGRHRRAPSRP